jgi:hypothetical protein
MKKPNCLESVDPASWLEANRDILPNSNPDCTRLRCSDKFFDRSGTTVRCWNMLFGWKHSEILYTKLYGGHGPKTTLALPDTLCGFSHRAT